MEALTADVADTLNAHAFQVGVAIHSLGDITDQPLMARWTTAVVDNLVTEAHKLTDLAPALKAAEFAQGTPVGLLLGEVEGKRPEDIDLRWWAASLGEQSEEVAQYYAVDLPPPGTVYWWQYDFMDPDLDAVPDDNALDVRQALAALMAPRPQPATQVRVSTPASPAQAAASPTPQETGPTEEHATEDVHSDRPSGEATATSTVAVSKSTRPRTRPVPKSTSGLGAAAGTTGDNSVVDDHVTVPKPTRPKARRVPKSTAEVGATAEDDTEEIEDEVVAPKPSRTKGRVVKSTTELGADAEGDHDTDTPEIQGGADVGAKTTRTPRRTTKAAKPAASPSKTARKGKGKKSQTEDTDDQPEEVPKRATRSQAVAEVSSVATGSTRPPKRKAGECK
ncbi:hypothetical protein DENSPDRAFT_887163 [Dentipellis sp. KUC8613]|nr:hypothetical protein DENSPDRAFT_887163 [Dentipellis sp. KUC8613]